MDFEKKLPNPQVDQQNIDALLNRISRLDKTARERLRLMLDDEMDLPYLDVMEREFARAFRKIAPDYANQLRGRFINALYEQRELLTGKVRSLLQQLDEDELLQMHPPIMRLE